MKRMAQLAQVTHKGAKTQRGWNKFLTASKSGVMKPEAERKPLIL